MNKAIKLNAINKSIKHMLLFLSKDKMTYVVFLAPLMCGAFFKYAIPYLESLIYKYLNIQTIFHPYYSLFDLCLSLFPTIMFCYPAAMMILEEADDHITGYLCVTPLGKSGYLLSRLGGMAIAAFFMTLLLLPAFSLIKMSFLMLLSVTLAGTAQGLITTFIIISFSSNKLEGMAAAKLSSLPILAIFVPYFIHTETGFLAAPFPAFWMSRSVLTGKVFYMFLSLVLSCFYMFLLYRLFIKRITK